MARDKQKCPPHSPGATSNYTDGNMAFEETHCTKCGARGVRIKGSREKIRMGQAWSWER